jgi:hypothetical protein
VRPKDIPPVALVHDWEAELPFPSLFRLVNELITMPVEVKKAE